MLDIMQGPLFALRPLAFKVCPAIPVPEADIESRYLFYLGFSVSRPDCILQACFGV